MISTTILDRMLLSLVIRVVMSVFCLNKVVTLFKIKSYIQTGYFSYSIAIDACSNNIQVDVAVADVGSSSVSFFPWIRL